MKDFYTFIVLSTINASKDICDSDTRFVETIDTLTSIHKHISNVKIIFVDNSIDPLTEEQKFQISQLADVSHYMEPTIVNEYTNNVGAKSLGEAILIYEGMKLAKQNNLIGKRIFKISGRYVLSDTFSIDEYDERYVGKYAWIYDPDDLTIYETTLMSFCPSIFDDYFRAISLMFTDMLRNLGNAHSNWGKTNVKFTNRADTIILDKMHVEGWRGLPRSQQPKYVKL